MAGEVGSDRFRWEQEFQHTWNPPRLSAQARRAKPMAGAAPNGRRGIVRNVLLVLDLSASSEDRDLLPSRKSVMSSAVKAFYRAFVENNPLSTMGVALVSDGACTKFSALVPDADLLAEMLGPKTFVGSGAFSLSAGMEAAAVLLKDTSCIKEVLLVVSSLSFADSDPSAHVNRLISRGIKIHCIHLAAEMAILRRIAKTSGGTFGVVSQPDDLFALMEPVTIPGPHQGTARLQMLRVGLPPGIVETSICACHLEVTEKGYECPFCRAKVCALPGICPVCDNALGATVHLLKAMHWVEPAEAFLPEAAPLETCRGCSRPASGYSTCPNCKSALCPDCDAFIHAELNFCPFD